MFSVIVPSNGDKKGRRGQWKKGLHAPQLISDVIYLTVLFCNSVLEC